MAGFLRAWPASMPAGLLRRLLTLPERLGCRCRALPPLLCRGLFRLLLAAAPTRGHLRSCRDGGRACGACDLLASPAGAGSGLAHLLPATANPTQQIVADLVNESSALADCSRLASNATTSTSGCVCIANKKNRVRFFCGKNLGEILLASAGLSWISLRATIKFIST